MKPLIIQQEVLIITSSEFSRRKYHNDASDTEKNPSEKERLKDECWNGKLNDRLPEAFAMADPAAEMYIFQMKEAQQFLLLVMGESPSEIDSFYSIDPYHFLTMQFFS